MKDKVFIDTNILIYLYSEDEPGKKERSLNAISNYDCVTSTQVLNELSNVMLKKFRVLPADLANVIDDIVYYCNVSTIDVGIIKNAIEITNKYKYSFYDSLIISSALDNECRLLLTEDMQNGQVIDGKLTITNIFS